MVRMETSCNINALCLAKALKALWRTLAKTGNEKTPLPILFASGFNYFL